MLQRRQLQMILPKRVDHISHILSMFLDIESNAIHEIAEVVGFFQNKHFLHLLVYPNFYSHVQSLSRHFLVLKEAEISVSF